MIARVQPHKLRSESGQAVVEYMLILVITVMLILTFIYQFSTAFKVYANNYFGEYIACLLETGELPGGGGDCSASYKAFNIKDGTTASGGSVAGSGGSGSGGGTSTSGSGSGSGGSGSGSNSSSKTSSTSKKSASSGSSSSSSSTPVAASTETGSSNSSGGFGSNLRRSSTTLANTGGKEAAGSKEGRAGLTPISGSGVSTSSSRETGGRRTQLARGFGYAGQEEEKERETSRPASKPIAQDEGGSLKPKKVAQAPPRAPASKDAEDSGFSLGNFIRLLLIAAILVAIFILFGSQILAISKGGEK